MLRTLLGAVAACGLVCALAPAVRAQPLPQAQDVHARSGPYLGVGGLVAFYTDVSEPFEVDAAGGLDGRVGYRAHPNYAMEIEFEWLSEADVQQMGVVGDVATLESMTFSINFKGYLLTGRIQPFVLLGNGFMQGEVTQFGFTNREQDYALRFGGGADYYITPHVYASAGVGYVLPLGSLSRLDYVSIQGGLGYRF